jgi:energy-dependent translational throttle protein EttA
VIGPNGAGKTTLLRMITGQEAPDDGSIHIGETVKLAYVDQSRESLDPEKNIWEEISERRTTKSIWVGANATRGRTLPVSTS